MIQAHFGDMGLYEIRRYRTMNELATMEWAPCKGGTPPMKGDKLNEWFARLGNGWTLVDEHHLKKEFKFRDFREALAFTNLVGQLAEQVDHHPDIYLTWGKVGITVWTHKIGGLCETDFIFAAKTDALVGLG